MAKEKTEAQIISDRISSAIEEPDIHDAACIANDVCGEIKSFIFQLNVVSKYIRSKSRRIKNPVYYEQEDIMVGTKPLNLFRAEMRKLLKDFLPIED